MRKIAVVLGLLTLAAGGFVASVAFTANGDVTCNTATATTPDHVIGVDGSPVATVPGASAVATACVTESDATVTVHDTTTETVTVTTGTTAPPPPPPPPPPSCPSSLQAAYDAGGGSVAGCSFSTPQTISGSRSADVTINATGATIAGALTIQASHLILNGGRASGSFNLYNGAYFDTFNNVGAAGSPNIFGDGHNLTFNGGDYGPGNEPSVTEGRVSPQGSGPLPHDILLNGVYIHDHNSTDLQCCHNGGFGLVGGYNITIQNSRFERNVIYDIEVDLVDGYGIPEPYNVTIQNNFFAAPVLGPPYGSPSTNDGQPELQLAAGKHPGLPVHDWLVRFNSFQNGLAMMWDGKLSGSGMYANVRVLGNLGGNLTDCLVAPGVTYTQNVWAKPKCGSSDGQVSSLPIASNSVTAPDLHLTGGLPVDFVTASTTDAALATDYDGQPRPNGAARDAGADER